MAEHELKTWPLHFEAVIVGDKTFEWRVDDRDFQGDDVLILREYRQPTTAAPETGYTGRVVRRRVGYALYGGNLGVPQGFVVMSLLPDGGGTDG